MPPDQLYSLFMFTLKPTNSERNPSRAEASSAVLVAVNTPSDRFVPSWCPLSTFALLKVSALARPLEKLLLEGPITCDFGRVLKEQGKSGEGGPPRLE